MENGLELLRKMLENSENLQTFELYLSGDIGISIQGVRLVV